MRKKSKGTGSKKNTDLREVSLAEAYRPGAMGSLGNARYMLVRQYEFPHYYDPAVDKIEHADHDRCFMWDHDHASRCFKEHTKTGNGVLAHWVQSATVKQVFAFLRDILKVKEHHPNVKWTGFRITGTVNRSNGYPVWSLELFSNKSGVETYSGPLAPNVKMPKVEGFFMDSFGNFAEIRRSDT